MQIDVNLQIAPEHVRDFPGLTTKMASKVLLMEQLNTVRATLGGPTPDNAHIRNLLRRIKFTVGRLIQSYDEISKFPRNRDDCWAYYCQPLQEVADALGLTPRLMERKANQFYGYPSWPASSNLMSLSVCAQC